MTLKLECANCGSDTIPCDCNGKGLTWHARAVDGDEADERMENIARNGNDGEHYDAVNHPKHYTDHPSGIECIQITEHMNFCLGNAVKYIWRADLKHDAIEDLKKAKWYLEREIAKREAATQSGHKVT